MTRTLGLWSAAIVTAAVVVFAMAMLAGQDYASWGACLVLSWAYLVLACALAAAADENSKATAQIGVAFATLYSGFATTVYFVQLTIVARQSAAPEILKVLTFRDLGSLMFNLDLLGYGMMAVSTFFIGLSMVAVGKADRWLKILLMLHGVFAPACVAMPILNIFGSMPLQSGNNAGTAALFAWCIYFTPIGVLAFMHFRAGRALAAERGQIPSFIPARSRL